MSTAADLRTLWRTWTTELDTAIPADEQIDIHFNSAMYWLNRRVGFYVKDSSTAITFVAETQEYTLPVDFVEPLWVEWNGVPLKKSSMRQFRTRNVPWRAASSGVPEEYYCYARKMGFYPKPSALAVSTEDNPTLRYIAAPPEFRDNSLTLLGTQDQLVLVTYAVAEWLNLYGVGGEHAARAQRLYQIAEAEAKGIAANYGAREVE